MNILIDLLPSSVKIDGTEYEINSDFRTSVLFSLLMEDDNLSEEEKVATLEKVKELITRFGGEITNVDDWGKRKLAYEIEKQREGFYYFIQFKAEATTQAEI